MYVRDCAKLLFQCAKMNVCVHKRVRASMCVKHDLKDTTEEVTSLTLQNTGVCVPFLLHGIIIFVRRSARKESASFLLFCARKAKYQPRFRRLKITVLFFSLCFVIVF